jgi:hypothetical protein
MSFIARSRNPTWPGIHPQPRKGRSWADRNIIRASFMRIDCGCIKTRNGRPPLLAASFFV